MANNQYVNKVIFGNETLIDLTSDTITAANMLNGITAHNAAGEIITGTLKNKTPTAAFYSGLFRVSFDRGIYDGLITLSGIKLTVPESGTTNTFYIDFPNNSAPASADDWTRITFSVDSNGNSNITDNTIPASGVSF